MCLLKCYKLKVRARVGLSLHCLLRYKLVYRFSLVVLVEQIRLTTQHGQAQYLLSNNISVIVTHTHTVLD